MDDKQVLKYIDNGANYYLRLFGEAEHMEYIDNGYYSYVKPKEGEQGITFIFDVRLDYITEEDKQKKVAEIKNLNMPIWLDLLAPDELHQILFGKDKEHGKKVLDNNDEAYMALLPGDKTNYESLVDDLIIVQVESAEQFHIWATLANDLLGGGSPDIHPKYHYPLIPKGLMKCYIGYKNDVPAVVSAILDDKGIASLEFVATISGMRRLGLAKAVCAKAIEDAFDNGAQIITLRAVGAGTVKLYEALGFQIYNHAI